MSAAISTIVDRGPTPVCIFSNSTGPAGRAVGRPCRDGEDATCVSRCSPDFAVAVCVGFGAAAPPIWRARTAASWRENRLAVFPGATAGPPARAFRCGVTLCGDDCRIVCAGRRSASAICDTGVADDDESRPPSPISTLMSERFAPLEPGKVIQIARQCQGAGGPTICLCRMGSRPLPAVGIAVARRCDLFGRGRRKARVRRRAFSAWRWIFLGSETLARWLVVGDWESR